MAMVDLASGPVEDLQRDAMICERKDGRVDRAVRCRSYAWEDPHSAPASGRLLEKKASSISDPCMAFRNFSDWQTRFFPGQRFGFDGAAELPHRTDLTLRTSLADKRGKIHERRIEDARAAGWNNSGGNSPNGVPTGR